MYRTGDMARRTADGVIEFAGREDSQVKILGFLVDLAEVEAALVGYPGLAQLVVLAHEREDGNKQLIGYVLPEPGGLDLAALRAHARSKLPGYMTPSVFVQLDALPLTANGKLDRAAMPEPDFDQVLASRAPQTQLHRTLCELFSALLEVPEVGIDDSFFETRRPVAAGDAAVSRIGATVGVGVSMNTLFDSPTVAQLATYIDAKRGAKQEPAVTR